MRVRSRQPPVPCTVRLFPLHSPADQRFCRHDLPRILGVGERDSFGVEAPPHGEAGAEWGVHVEFELPARALAKLQALALYEGDVCLGGGLLGGYSESYHALGSAVPAEAMLPEHTDSV